MSCLVRGLTSRVLHVDVIAVHPVPLTQGVRHPAALRVPLFAWPIHWRGFLQQPQALTLLRAGLLIGALLEFQALGTGAAEEQPRERVCKRVCTHMQEGALTVLPNVASVTPGVGGMQGQGPS